MRGFGMIPVPNKTLNKIKKTKFELFSDALMQKRSVSYLKYITGVITLMNVKLLHISGE